MATNNQQPVGASATSSVTSSKPIGELTKEERKKRYNDLREKIGKPKLEVKGESGIHYFWGPKDDTSEHARLDTMGYSIVNEPNAKEVLAGKAKPKITASGLRTDGTYVLGDVILMQCPEETYEYIQLDIADRHEELVTGSTENFKIEANRRGVPAFDVAK